MVAVAAVKAAVEANKANGGRSPNARNSGARTDANTGILREAKHCPRFWQYQAQAREFYRNTKTEIFVAGLIGGNFLMNLIEATIDPQKTKHTDVFGAFELFFNVAFTIELGINMYAFWLCDFWSSSWNVFDFVVVSIGLMTTLSVPLPGPLKMLRMMRAFRVFRLFKRIKSLKKIMDSLGKAIPGVVNAFVILVLVMCIYSILAVEFWSTYGLGGTIINEDGVEIELITSRGQDYGWEYFGNFPKSMYTMFQVLTGESWSEVIARPLLHGPDAMSNLGTALYFVSFVVLCAVILINVVVAVLLEKMVDDTSGPAGPDSKKPAPPKRGSSNGSIESSIQNSMETSMDNRMENIKKDEIVTLRRDLDELKGQVGEILKVVSLIAENSGVGDLRDAASASCSNASVSIRPPSECASRQPPTDEPTKMDLPGTPSVEPAEEPTNEPTNVDLPGTLPGGRG